MSLVIVFRSDVWFIEQLLYNYLQIKLWSHWTSPSFWMTRVFSLMSQAVLIDGMILAVLLRLVSFSFLEPNWVMLTVDQQYFELWSVVMIFLRPILHTFYFWGHHFFRVFASRKVVWSFPVNVLELPSVHETSWNHQRSEFQGPQNFQLPLVLSFHNSSRFDAFNSDLAASESLKMSDVLYMNHRSITISWWCTTRIALNISQAYYKTYWSHLKASNSNHLFTLKRLELELPLELDPNLWPALLPPTRFGRPCDVVVAVGIA